MGVEHTYKPDLGTDCAIRGIYRGHTGGSAIFDVRDDAMVRDVAIWNRHDIAPWMSAEEQDALLRGMRLVRWFTEAAKWFRCADCNGTGAAMNYNLGPLGEPMGEPYPVQCDCGRLTDAAKEGEALLSSMPDSLRARLEEGEG